MLAIKNNNNKGFTLVEIMIVVAIIALLAAIAVPSFLRARKRSQATQALETLRVIDGAKDQYAIEWGKPGSVVPNWNDLYPYVKRGSKLYNQMVGNAAPVDALNNPFSMNTIDAPPTVSTATKSAVSDVIPNPTDFWGSYY